jgi:hypothetical protein
MSLTNNRNPLNIEVTQISDAMPINKPKNANTLMKEMNERCLIEKRYVRDNNKGMRIYSVLSLAGIDLNVVNSLRK